jgi:xanthine/uracil permease
VKTFTPLGWIILLLLFYLFSKTKIGYNLIFYILVLVLVLELVGNSKAINQVMMKQNN